MWAWANQGMTEINNLLNNPNKQQAFIRFLREPSSNSRPITRIFLEARDLNKDNKTAPFIIQYDPLRDQPKGSREKLAAFIAAIKAHGIAVEFLDGQISWLEEQYVDHGSNVCRDVANYNANVSKEQRFDGVHLDIEPHQRLARWYQNDDILSYYKQIFIGCRNHLIEYEKEYQHTMILAADIGTDWWYYASKLNSFFNDHMQGNVKTIDYVAVMNYFNDEETYFTGVSDIQQIKDWYYNGSTPIAGSDNNIKHYTLPMMFGMETMQTVPHVIPEWMTFYEKGTHELHQLINKIQNRYANNSQAKGVAIHYYDTFKALIESE